MEEENGKEGTRKRGGGTRRRGGGVLLLVIALCGSVDCKSHKQCFNVLFFW